jgi:NAD(P) transhydrogenase subunit alpha
MKVTTIGVLDDDGGRESRVALVPDGVRRMARLGLSVVVEAGAGAHAWYPDDAYAAAGAQVASRRKVFESADVLLTVSKPCLDDLPLMRPGQMMVGLLGPQNEPELVRSMASRGVIAVSLESLPRTLSRAQAMDVLTSQASVAGYKAVLVGAAAFGRYFPMLITAAGTSRPASVLVLGAGVAGLSAIGTARRLGAVVTGYDVRPEAQGEVESLGARFLDLKAVESAAGEGGYARALTPEEQRAQQEELESHLPSFDVVITTAAVPGRRPPLLVSASALAKMRAGSVVVDMGSGPLGGNVEGSIPGGTTTTANGVTLIGASNLASTVPTAASDAFSQNLTAVLGLFIKDGELTIDLTDEVQAAIVLTNEGQVVHPSLVPSATDATMEDPDARVAAL